MAKPYPLASLFFVFLSWTPSTYATDHFGYAWVIPINSTAVGFNSRGGSIMVKDVDAVRGESTVVFEDLGNHRSAGHVQVSARGNDSAHCVIRSWSPPVALSPRNIEIRVACLNSRGLPASPYHQYHVLFLADADVFDSSEGNGVSWVLADRPTTPVYRPEALFSVNPFRAPNQVVRRDIGRYSVLFPGMAERVGSWSSRGGRFGNVQISAYGSGSHHCKVERWVRVAPAPNVDLWVDVACFNGTGGRIDAAFTALVMYPDGIRTLTPLPGVGISRSTLRRGDVAFAWSPRSGARSSLSNIDYVFGGQLPGAVSLANRTANIRTSGVMDHLSLSPFAYAGIANGAIALITAYGLDPGTCAIVAYNGLALAAELDERAREIVLDPQCMAIPGGGATDSGYSLLVLAGSRRDAPLMSGALDVDVTRFESFTTDAPAGAGCGRPLHCFGVRYTPSAAGVGATTFAADFAACESGVPNPMDFDSFQLDASVVWRGVATDFLVAANIGGREIDRGDPLCGGADDVVDLSSTASDRLTFTLAPKWGIVERAGRTHVIPAHIVEDSSGSAPFGADKARVTYTVREGFLE